MTAPRSWEIRLAYPTLPISLNDRGTKWQIKWRASRTLRDRVRVMTRHLEIPRLEAIHVDMTWIPATKRKRDADNAVATLKPAIDGLRDYRARYRNTAAGRVLVEPEWVGVVPDDDPEHVTWSPPVIAPPDPDRFLTERLVLVIAERTAP